MLEIQKVRVIKDNKICNVPFQEFMEQVFAEVLKRMDKIEVKEED